MDMSKYILTSDGKIHVRNNNVSLFDVDEKFEEAARLVIENRVGSAPLIQRRLEVGYARAARILDQLEQAGILGSAEGNKPRDVIISSFDEFIKSEGKGTRPEEVFPEGIKKEWEPKEISNISLYSLQNKAFNSTEIRIPVGFDKKKLVSATIDELGHIYVFNSPMCNSIGLLKTQLEFLIKTYSPETIKLIVSDDTRLLSTLPIASAPQLLTPIINNPDKLANGLSWLVSETDRRFQLIEEGGILNLPKIVCVLSSQTGRLAHDGDACSNIEYLLGSGNLVGVHLIISSPLIENKFSKLMTSFSTKIIFKTFSISSADLLGTDDAFDLTNVDEFVYLPAYGEMQKLKVYG